MNDAGQFFSQGAIPKRFACAIGNSRASGGEPCLGIEHAPEQFVGVDYTALQAVFPAVAVDVDQLLEDAAFIGFKSVGKKIAGEFDAQEARFVDEQAERGRLIFVINLSPHGCGVGNRRKHGRKH